jgi:hypothetical protein
MRRHDHGLHTARRRPHGHPLRRYRPRLSSSTSWTTTTFRRKKWIRS